MMRKLWPLVPLIAILAILFISGSAMVVEKVDVTATPQIAMLNEQVVDNGNVEAIANMAYEPMANWSSDAAQTRIENLNYEEVSGQIRANETICTAYEVEIEANARSGCYIDDAVNSAALIAKNYDVANNSGRIQVNARDCCTVNNAAQSSARTANDVAEVTRVLRTVMRC